jgi:hypothetical protein
MRSFFKFVEIKDDHAVVTNGTKWDGTPALFKCEKAGLESARVGDRLSAEGSLDTGMLEKAFLEDRPDLRPAPPKPPAPVTWNPNDTGDSEFLSPEGFPLDMKDVDRLLREQAETIKALTARVRKLEVFSPVHCNVCRSHIAASGAFDQR